MPARPNILFCTCDQLRAFETGCYGNPVIRTPHLDRLAAEGVRFETAVTNAPVCMAARSIMMSGQYNRTCTGGATNVGTPYWPGGFTLPEYPDPGRPHLKDPTLPEILRRAGYHTSLIGKWHIHSWPGDVGFDDYVMPRVHHCHTGQSYTENGGPEFVPPGWSMDFEADRLERFLEGRRQNREPFFLFYNLSPPHCPVADQPEEYRTLYRPEDIPIRANVDLSRPVENQDHAFKIYRWDFRYYSFHLPYTRELPPGYSLRHLIAEYYGMTTWMDAAIGRMLATLDATGLARDTIVVFTSDHGDNLGSHGLVQKSGPNEESIRIPFMVRWPGGGVGPAVARNTVASLVDIAPTLLSLAGIKPPEHFHGRDLSAVLLGKNAGDAASWAVIEAEKGVAIRTLRHMYFLPYTGRARELSDRPAQVFDLLDDPCELTNLAAGPLPAEARELDRLLREWHARTKWMPSG